MHTFALQRSRRVAFPLFVAALLLTVGLSRAGAETPIEEAARCITEAWNKNYACQTNDSRWDDVLCAVKFEAELIVCTFKVLPG